MSTEVSMECQLSVSMECFDQHLTSVAVSTHDPFSLCAGCSCRIICSSLIPLLSLGDTIAITNISLLCTL